MLKKRVYKHKSPSGPSRSSQLSYLILAFEAGFCLTILSSATWGQAQATEEGAETPPDGPPDQPMAKSAVPQPEPKSATKAGPETRSGAAFSKDQVAVSPVTSSPSPGPVTTASPQPAAKTTTAAPEPATTSVIENVSRAQVSPPESSGPPTPAAVTAVAGAEVAPARGEPQPHRPMVSIPGSPATVPKVQFSKTTPPVVIPRFNSPSGAVSKDGAADSDSPPSEAFPAGDNPASTPQPALSPLATETPESANSGQETSRSSQQLGNSPSADSPEANRAESLHESARAEQGATGQSQSSHQAETTSNLASPTSRPEPQQEMPPGPSEHKRDSQPLPAIVPPPASGAATPSPHQPSPTVNNPRVGDKYSSSARDLLLPQPETQAAVHFSSSRLTAVAATRSQARSSPSNPTIPAMDLLQSDLDLTSDAAEDVFQRPEPPAEEVPPQPHAEADAEDAETSQVRADQIETNEYLRNPLTIPPGVLAPLVTTIPFNNELLDYGSRSQIIAGVSFGDDRSTNLRYSGLAHFNQNVASETGPDNRTTLTQRQSVLFARDTLQERRLAISFGEPVRILGQDIQLSLTGSCLDPSVDEICTYTPGLATDNASIDEATQLPTRFEQTSNFGDVVAPETLAAMQAPGFQQGTEAQRIGIDLQFPQVAILPGNSQSNMTAVIRDEQFTTTPAVGYATVSQTVQANATEAALARNIRGPAVVFDSDQPITNIVLAALALALPEIRASVPSTDAPANQNVNLNLFNAANNTRLPTDSFTLYQAGVGYADTPVEPLERSHDRPRANFNAVWLGLSPVTERSYEEGFAFTPLGERVQTLAAGGEGGGGDIPDLTSLVEGTAFNVDTVDNVYVQNYINLYEQDALNLVTFEQRDQIRYYPHLSFSGNITGAYDTFRYYLGTIAGEQIQAYGGLDYQGRTDGNWYYRAGAIGFINPNYDRYSNLSGGIAKRFDFNENHNLTLGGSFNWALDQDTSLGDIEQTGEGSDITLQARMNLGQVSVGATQVLGGILPHSQATRTVFDTSVRLGEDVTLSGFWAPFDDAVSAPVFGLLADIGFRLGEVEPGLIVSWQNTRYEYGQDPFGNDLTTTGNLFEVLLRMNW